MILVMDNFRAPRRAAYQSHAIDGFARTASGRQTVYRNITDPYLGSITRVPEPLQAVAPQPQPQTPPQPLQAPQYVFEPVPVAQPAYIPPVEPMPAPLPEQPLQQTEAPAVRSGFDIATIEEFDKPKNRLAAGRAFRKWMLRGGLITMALFIGVGGLLFAQGYSKVHKVFRGNERPSALNASAVQLLKGESAGRVNVLLLGNGGDGHQAPDLTDTLIVESVDTVHKTAAMFSIPRDLWVQIPKYGNMKINAAYEVGKYNSLGKIDDSNANTDAVMAGFKQVDQAIQTVLGINIDYNVLVNFTSFKQAVDSVGGVTVNVPEALVDPTMAWENGHNPVLAAAGTQQMNGKQALMYVRSRETSSDFARSQRQRSILLALKDKVLSAGTLGNPIKVSQLINAFGDNLVTDFSLSEGMRAYSIGKVITNEKIASIDLVTPPNNLITTGNMNGVSIDVPRAGQFDYAAIQDYVKQTLAGTSATTAAPAAPNSASPTTTTPAETAQISVLNGTSKEGLAGSKAAKLKTAGYNVIQVGNAPTKTYAKTTIVDLSNGTDPKTKSYLESTFGVTSVTTLPAGVAAGTANFVVILGAEQTL